MASFSMISRAGASMQAYTDEHHHLHPHMLSEAMTDTDLLAQLKAKYERTPPGECPVCGAQVAVEPHAGGYPLPWICPVGKKALEEAKAASASPETIQELEDHVRHSRWEDFRRVGDRRVMELISRYEALKGASSTDTSTNQSG